MAALDPITEVRQEDGNTTDDQPSLHQSFRSELSPNVIGRNNNYNNELELICEEEIDDLEIMDDQDRDFPV